MTPLRQAKMTRFFNIYDAERNGSIQKIHFELPVKAGASFLGFEEGSDEYNDMYKWSMGFWNYLCKNLNKGDDDTISLQEFLDAMDDLTNDRASLNDIMIGHANFTLKIWDRDHDGMMSEDEFVAAHTAYNTDAAAARVAFGHLDRNGDQQLSVGEIITAIEEYFTSDDPNAIGNWFILDSESVSA